ncbi:MAG: protoporphyrinogen oxidase, partial [Actinomycetota bacterium]
SIYAADTDNFSMAAVPQIAALTAQRSMLLAAGKTRALAAKGPATPIFCTPLRGMGALIESLTQRVSALGGRIQTGERVTAIEKSAEGFTISTTITSHDADAVVVASPAKHSAEFLRTLDARAADLLAQWTHASVVLITMAIPSAQWPARFTGSARSTVGDCCIVWFKQMGTLETNRRFHDPARVTRPRRARCHG